MVHVLLLFTGTPRVVEINVYIDVPMVYENGASVISTGALLCDLEATELLIHTLKLLRGG